MTNKPKKKKKRFKFKKFFVFLLTLTFIVMIIYTVATFKIKNIYVSGNTILSDQEIITIAKLNNYPSFLFTSAILTEMRLEKDPIIKNATINKSFWGVVTIKIVEYQPYFIYHDELIMTDNQKMNIEDLPTNISVPILISDISKSIYNELVDSFVDINTTIISKISEIEYKPSALDDERFLFLMTDGNYAYITMNNIKNINYYNKIVTQLVGKKGIINFDSYRKTDAGITIEIIK